MGKNPKRKRRFRKYLRGSINHTLALSTLAAKTLITSLVGDVVTEKAWCSSVKLAWQVAEWTPAVGDGPIMVGVAHSDYSTAELEAWIENTSSWEEGDQVQQEIAKRKIRRVGTFTTLGDVAAQMTLNDGKPIRTKCGWMLTTGQTIRVWAYNMGTSAFSVTDPQVQCEGHANLWPA